ncbi:putative aminoacyltransferase, E1 ubiquitin-activating enzyme [Rosa chinensis]|uniref:Putative aminoacyltransferase, E1 ubiquitin-activating enzyme n=1 Tax=Rosa chinensis TaxID=74649 RepID=A0A2P6RNW1_ROSCH|nr:putative aminoacyltransferase, E1 ubiquitin-activating enzyme [Rosa chinensis]
MRRIASGRLVPRNCSCPSAMETRADLKGVKSQVQNLVEELHGTCVNTQREATLQLRLLAKHNMNNRIVIANCGAISFLVGLLSSTDKRVQENAVTALLNLSINNDNEIRIATAAKAIESVVHVLENGSDEVKENSAATLFSLSMTWENKVRIGRSKAIRPLVELLGNGSLRGEKRCSYSIYLVEFVMNPEAGIVYQTIAVLAAFCTSHEGRIAIVEEGGVPVLVEVLKLGSERGKENAAAALLQLCTSSDEQCSMVVDKGVVPSLVAMSQSGTPRAKENV